jgi:DHA3 family macrolide efflux protein-like MFS transporter
MWAGQAISLIGSRVVQFALIWWLTQETGSATVLATATIVALIPEIVLMPFAGAYVDRWNRRLVMIVADGAVALASLLLAYLFWTGSAQIWHIYAIMLVRAVGGSFHWPAMQASTTLMVPEGQLTRIAGLNQTLNGVLTIAGPPLGALLMATVAVAGVMMVDVATALLAIVPLLFVVVPQPRERTAAEKEQSIWVDMRQGLDYIRYWPGLVALIAVALILKLALTPAMAIIPLLVSDHFQGTAGQLALMESIAGVGMLLGGLLLSFWGGFKRRIHTTILGVGLTGLSLLLLGLTPANLFTMALAVAFGIGLAIPLTDGPVMAILQATVAPEMQGRVFTLIGSLLSLSSPIGLAVAGPVSDWMGLQIWFLIAGGLCALASGLLLFVPALIHIEDNRQPALVEAGRELEQGQEQGEESLEAAEASV